MGGIVVLLLPEMLGLIITPAAVMATVILLGSSRSLLNVGTFAAGFLGTYLVISVIVVGGGNAAGATDESSGTVRAVVSLAVGAFFLGGACVLWARRHRPTSGAPGWVERVQDPSPRRLLALGAGLSILNPNLAILVSGMGMVLASDLQVRGQVVGVALLLAASALDFVVPTLMLLATGERGRSWLAALAVWLVAHDRPIGISVLCGFGLLFSLRGLGQLAA